jgi:rhamnulokinase
LRKQSVILAFDIGASSGRAIIGKYDRELSLVEIEEIHRFPNDPVRMNGHLHWDILKLLHEVKQGIRRANELGYTHIESIAIDTWAVDFGLLDVEGKLLCNPYHYRDSLTDGVMEQVVEKLGRERLYAASGLQFLPFNTIYQLYALKLHDPELLARADKLLMIPDLLRYYLTDELHSEFTNATTTQLLNATTQAWDEAILGELGIPEHLFVAPVQSGTVIGRLSDAICNELGVAQIPVIAVGEHDTASAVAAVPSLTGEHFAYLSSGTWSLMGTEVRKPVVSERALALNFTNEGGVYDTYRLLKNIMGLWIVQECRRVWEMEGQIWTFAELVELASKAVPFQSLIDPDHPMFLNPAHMPKQIQQYCRESSQYVPTMPGAMIRCVLESLALKYRVVLEWTEQLSGHRYRGLHLVGGGSNNALLNQFTANAIARPVWVGPTEASAIGNLIVQWITLGHISDLDEGRTLIRQSFPPDVYEPVELELWNKAYEKFRVITAID